MSELAVKIKKLTDVCKGGFSIEVNPHSGTYESIEEYLGDEIKNNDISAEDLSRVIKSNTLICVQAYPNTPVGFYLIFDDDVEKAIDRIIEYIKN